MMKICCRVCGSEHENAMPFEDSTQGLGCAASAGTTLSGEYVIRGHYGSRHDLKEFRGKQPPGWPTEANPVCDACIELAVSEGHITFEEEVLF